MKKIILTLTIAFISFNAFSQTKKEITPNDFYSFINTQNDAYVIGFLVDSLNKEAGFTFKTPKNIHRLIYSITCDLAKTTEGEIPDYTMKYASIVKENNSVLLKHDSLLLKDIKGTSIDTILMTLNNVMYVVFKQSSNKYCNLSLAYVKSAPTGKQFMQISEGTPISTVDTKSSYSFDISVYPNPTTGTLFFSETVKQVDVISLKGSMLMSRLNTSSIDVTSLASGVYTLSITDSQGYSIIKEIVKQ